MSQTPSIWTSIALVQTAAATTQTPSVFIPIPFQTSPQVQSMPSPLVSGPLGDGSAPRTETPSAPLEDLSIEFN